METVNPSDWHLIPRGTAFEDYVVGRVCDHLWGRTVHGSDNISFTTQTLAFNPDYFNRVTAEAAGHPSEVVNPMPVFGLNVEDLSEADGPFLGASAIEYLRDVYPGQSLSAASTVIDARLSASRADVGIVTWQTIGRVSSGEPVISFRRTNQVGWRIEQPKLAAVPKGFAEDFVGACFRHARTRTVTDLDLNGLAPRNEYCVRSLRRAGSWWGPFRRAHQLRRPDVGSHHRARDPNHQRAGDLRGRTR